jgi:hypothetical protein
MISSADTLPLQAFGHGHQADDGRGRIAKIKPSGCYAHAVLLEQQWRVPRLVFVGVLGIINANATTRFKKLLPADAMVGRPFFRGVHLHEFVGHVCFLT